METLLRYGLQFNAAGFPREFPRKKSMTNSQRSLILPMMSKYKEQ